MPLKQPPCLLGCRWHSPVSQAQLASRKTEAQRSQASQGALGFKPRTPAWFIGGEGARNSQATTRPTKERACQILLGVNIPPQASAPCCFHAVSHRLGLRLWLGPWVLEHRGGQSTKLPAWKKKHSECPVIRRSRTTKTEVSGRVRVVRASGMMSPSGYIHPNKKLLPGQVLGRWASWAPGTICAKGLMSWTRLLAFCPWTSVCVLSREEIRHWGSQCLASSFSEVAAQTQSLVARARDLHQQSRQGVQQQRGVQRRPPQAGASRRLSTPSRKEACPIR